VTVTDTPIRFRDVDHAMRCVDPHCWRCNQGTPVLDSVRAVEVRERFAPLLAPNWRLRHPVTVRCLFCPGFSVRVDSLEQLAGLFTAHAGERSHQLRLRMFPSPAGPPEVA
jgi:hypothetical protein